MSSISKFFSNYWMYIAILLVVVFIILVLTKVINFSPTTKSSSTTPKKDSKLSTSCQDKKKKSCQGLIENLIKIKKTDPNYQETLQKCLDTKTMNPFGCPTEGRVDFNDYCQAYNKMIGQEICNKNNPNFYFNTSFVKDFWNQSYKCAQNSNDLNQYSECFRNIDSTTWFDN